MGASNEFETSCQRSWRDRRR